MRASFVIPSYNSAAFLAHAIESCRKQTYANLEIIVVDDASTDSTPKLMEFLTSVDTRIKYIRLEENKGRSNARNVGNDAATGDFLMVLDADDIAYPDRSKLTAEKMRKGIDFLHGSCDYIDAVGSMLGTHIADVFNYERSLDNGLNYMIHSSCAYRRNIAIEFPYRTELSELGLDDWGMQTEVALSGRSIDHIIPVIGAYRDLETGISKRRSQDMVLKAKESFLEKIGYVRRNARLPTMQTA